MTRRQFNLVTDRTADDVARWRYLRDKTLIDEEGNVIAKGWGALTSEEKNEWLVGGKGTYNYTDLNRVESVVEYLAELLVVRGVVTKTDWSVQDVPTKADMRRYLDNIQKIKDKTTVNTIVSPPRSMQKLTWAGANSIEQLLSQLLNWAENYAGVQYYSGDAFLYCGGDL